MRDQPSLGHMRSNRTYDDDQYEDVVDPVKLTLEDYDVFSRMQQRRKYLYRNLPVHNEEDDLYMFDDMVPRRPRVIFTKDNKSLILFF